MEKRTLALVSILLLTACSDKSLYGSGKCPPPADWRKPGELGHHEQANFVQVKSDGSLSVGVLVPSGLHSGESITEPQFLQFLRDMKDAAPTPSFILQPQPRATCVQVRRLRKALAIDRDCNYRCGEGEGWTLFGDLPIETAPGS